jgi:hypothetical protein
MSSSSVVRFELLRVLSRSRLTRLLFCKSAQPAKALYSYTAASEEEFSFEENASLTIVDTSDPSWWQAEQGGTIKLVPATYIELSQ